MTTAVQHSTKKVSRISNLMKQPALIILNKLKKWQIQKSKKDDKVGRKVS